MTAADFLRHLEEEVPEVAGLVQSHLDDYGELLVHLLMSDLFRFSRGAFKQGDMTLSGRCLDAVTSALTQGDQHLENAVAVSFVELVWDSERKFLASWPEPLLAEYHRQRPGA